MLKILLGRAAQPKHVPAPSVVPRRSQVVASGFPGAYLLGEPQDLIGARDRHPKPETIGAGTGSQKPLRPRWPPPNRRRLLSILALAAQEFDVVNSEGKYCCGAHRARFARNDRLPPQQHRASAARAPSGAAPGHRTQHCRGDALRRGSKHHRGLIAENFSRKNSNKSLPPHARIPPPPAADAAPSLSPPRFSQRCLPHLTLEGLRLIGCRNFPAGSRFPSIFERRPARQASLRVHSNRRERVSTSVGDAYLGKRNSLIFPSPELFLTRATLHPVSGVLVKLQFNLSNF